MRGDKWLDGMLCPVASGAWGLPTVSLGPALGVSTCPRSVKGPAGGLTRPMGAKGSGRQGSSGGGTGTYLGAWGSREPWLAWRPVIPLRREQLRLQPSGPGYWL